MTKRIGLMTLLLLLASSAAAQSGGKLTLQQKRDLARLACKDMGKEAESLECKGKPIDRIVKQIEFEQLDLNRDAQAEYQLSVPVEMIKSIDIAIYQKTRQGYRLLYNGLSRGVEVKKTRTNGYYDLEEMDAGVGPIYTIYKYDGNKYRKTR